MPMATKIMVVTHGALAYALRDAVGMFFGDNSQEIIALGLEPNDSLDKFRATVDEALEKNYSDDGILIFVDMVCGTPFNTVAMVLGNFVANHPQVECIAGINLPVLMEAFSDRAEKKARELKYEAIELFPQTYVDLREMLEF